MHKKVNINGKEYFMRRNPRGYGWEIMEKTLHLVGNETAEYRCLFNSLDDALVQRYFAQFEGGNIITNFPPTSHETYPEKILVHRTKHFTVHYHVPTLEILEKTCRFILIQEYGKMVDHIQPEDMVENTSGVKSMEEVESIPIEEVREKVREEFKKYLKHVKEQTRYKMDWLNLKQVLAGGGNVFNAIEAFEYDNIDQENLITVS